MPALTKFYGLSPVDIEDMTYREVSEYLVQMKQAQQEERG